MDLGTNIFLEYQIVLDSNPVKLTKELDPLIASGRRVYAWSKKILPIDMMFNCCNTIVETNVDEEKIHQQVFNMKLSGKTYKEISKETGVKFDRIPFYIGVEPGKVWTLNDWFADYFKKDSTIYPKVDMLIDTDPRIVDRFTRNGIPAKLVEKII